jgi:uncharacterized membrane protein YdjX (TVP38/TMEM64 family)
MNRLPFSRQQWLALMVLMAMITAAWVYREPLVTHLRHVDTARAWFHELGVFGPLILIAINSLQIVVAPIPGYVVQIAAGWVYGVWPGAFYAIIGLAVGAFLAMSLARLLGRPFALRVLGAERLAHWEHVVHADRLWLWALLFLGPVGDVPYILAGLSRFPIPRLLLLALVIRSPGVVVAAAVGAGLMGLDLALLYERAVAWVLTLSPWWLIGPSLALPILVWIAYRLIRRLTTAITAWLQQRVLHRMGAHDSPSQ